MSSSSINEYVERMLKEEFKVFDEDQEDIQADQLEVKKSHSALTVINEDEAM